ncbi:MAG: GNAT family N-acetyltransferase, partial [Pseudomonadota bacterium]
MGRFFKGRYVARFAETEDDIAAAQRLRHRAFRGAGDPGARDADAFDAVCRHVLIEDRKTGDLVCCFRLLPLEDGAQISQSYAAQYYELSALEGYTGRMVEMGRFCIAPGLKDPDIIRVAWGAMSRYVDETGTDMLFGCASFQGTDADGYHDAFAMLKERHLAPTRWLPKVKAPDVFRFARRLRR